jgi:hypothetical protein
MLDGTVSQGKEESILGFFIIRFIWNITSIHVQITLNTNAKLLAKKLIGGCILRRC